MLRRVKKDVENELSDKVCLVHILPQLLVWTYLYASEHHNLSLLQPCGLCGALLWTYSLLSYVASPSKVCRPLDNIIICPVESGQTAGLTSLKGMGIKSGFQIVGASTPLLKFANTWSVPITFFCIFVLSSVHFACVGQMTGCEHRPQNDIHCVFWRTWPRWGEDCIPS